MRFNDLLDESEWGWAYGSNFPYQFVTKCSDGGHGPGGEAIHDMVDRGREISYRTFMKEVGGAEQMVQVFPMYNWPSVGHRGHGLAMKDDYTMKSDAFFRSTWYGLACVYCVWSGIEFIFTKGGITPESQGINRQEYLFNLDYVEESLLEHNMSPYGEYAYHCTFEQNVPSIIERGLLTGEEPNWDETRHGWLYASDHDGAEWYRDELGAYEMPLVILRFPMPKKRAVDQRGNHADFMFQQDIPVKQIEIESEPGGEFIPITAYKRAVALTEVSYEPEHPHKDNIAVPLLDKAYWRAKRMNLMKPLGKLGPFDLMVTNDSGDLWDFYLVNQDGNPRGQLVLGHSQGRGERKVIDVYLMPEARGNGYKLYKFLLASGYVLRTGRTHSEDGRRMWEKMIQDPAVDVRLNYDKEATLEDMDTLYSSDIYFLTASAKGKLTEATKPRFKTKAPDEDWRSRVRDWKGTDCTVNDDPVAEKLKRMLLSIGGWAVCGLDDDDRDTIMARGQLWKGRGAFFMKGRPISCHQNVSALWEVNRDQMQICTGFALSPDGMWRVHTWGQCQGKPVETTVKRVAYFGFVMTDEEATKFADDNYF